MLTSTFLVKTLIETLGSVLVAFCHLEVYLMAILTHFLTSDPKKRNLCWVSQCKVCSVPIWSRLIHFWGWNGPKRDLAENPRWLPSTCSTQKPICYLLAYPIGGYQIKFDDDACISEVTMLIVQLWPVSVAFGATFWQVWQPFWPTCRHPIAKNVLYFWKPIPMCIQFEFSPNWCMFEGRMATCVNFGTASIVSGQVHFWPFRLQKRTDLNQIGTEDTLNHGFQNKERFSMLKVWKWVKMAAKMSKIAFFQKIQDGRHTNYAMCPKISLCMLVEVC